MALSDPSPVSASSPGESSVLEVPAEVTRVLRLVGDALARFDADALVATEPELADLAERLAHLTELTEAQRASLQPMLARARDALVRCERLGAKLTTLAEESYAAAAPAYERGGLLPPRKGGPRMEAKA